MIFLILDYLNYRSLKGRYSNAPPSLLTDLFDEIIPEEVIDVLKPGDLIWMYSKKSVRSWLIMYYCRLTLSHASMYVGDRTIIHSTRDRGVVKQRIDDLFYRGLRFLPCTMILGEKRKVVSEVAGSWLGTPYTYRYLIRAWFYIITGRNWGTFNWRFYLDFLVLFLCLDVILFATLNFFFFVYFSLIHLVVILAFGLLWKFKPIPFNTKFMSFNMIFAHFLLGEVPMMSMINKFSNIENIK